ncbi:MAG: hypothetical protein A3K67_01915 [Euryarchaeota archaeon RBG_16_62_10]|nr:MAG: hypothetical protein A3K67_01915 [Euryarchaeota archaeon RBG_16_62_10]
MLVMEELAYPSLSVLYPYYHTTSDTSDKVSPDQTQEVTRALLGAVLILLVNEGSSILLVVAGAAASVAVVALVTGVLYFRSRRKKEKRE